jgi:hypothetical protein
MTCWASPVPLEASKSQFASLVADCRIANVSLPEWGVEHPAIASAGPVAVVERSPFQRIDLPGLAKAVRAGQIRRVEWSGYGQRMENFLPRAHYQQIFAAHRPPAFRFGPRHLVCPVRTGDILTGEHRDYPLTPVEFYQQLAEATGLQPVFVGQTEPNDYTDRLRAGFPDAMFLASEGPLGDFELIRAASNIAIGVSTFAWLAAWLSQADNIFMAVSGLFHPMQTRDVDLLPFGDDRYKFWLFPFNLPVPLDRHAAVHRRLAPYLRLVPHDVLQRQLREAPRFGCSLARFAAAFDEAFYLAANPDVRAAVDAGHLGSGRDHYIRYGFAERRLPFAVDAAWYSEQYPLAAFELAQGDYADFADHYLAVGEARGYRPLPG